MFGLLVTFFTVLFQFHAIFAATSCQCGQPGPGDQVVTGNYDILTGLNISAPGKWCWQVALQSETGSIFCTAVLIDRLYAIAPAQCIFGRQANTTFLRAGSFDLSVSDNSSQILAVDSLTINQGYLNVDTSNEYNIGVIQLAAPVDCAANNVCVVCLPGRNSPDPSSSTCLATTWNSRVTGGKSSPRPMRERPASVMNQVDCELAVRQDNAIQSDYHVAESKFCLKEATDNISHCLGDLGDPLVCFNNATSRYEVIGLNTIGFSCFRRSLPSFYVRISSFADWISNLTDRQSQARNLPATFNIPDTAQPAAIQRPAVASITVVVNGSASTATDAPSVPVTPAPSVVSIPVVPIAPAVVTSPVATPAPATVLSPAATGFATFPAVLFTQGDAGALPPMKPMVSTQHMAADGSMEQVGADGSIQRTQPMPSATLQQVSPGIFRANSGGAFVAVTPTGQQPVAPDAASGQSQTPVLTRQKRDVQTGVIAPNNSFNGLNLNVPTINVAASDVGYNPTTGKFEFHLPQGGTAFSSVSFVPSSVDDIKNQIIQQQDKILAQVNNFKQNILVSINNNLPQFRQGNPGLASNAGNSPVLSNANNAASTSRLVAQPVAQPVGNSDSLASNSGAISNLNTRSASVQQSAPLTQADDDDYDDAPAPATSSAFQPNAGRVGSLISSASAGNMQPAQLVAPLAGTAGGSGFRTAFDSPAPANGAFNTHFDSGNNHGDAGVGFSGANVHAETVHTPGSSSSSVSASSG